MKKFVGAILVSLMLAPVASAGQRLSVEGGMTVPLFAYDKEEEGKPYGTKGSYGMANYAYSGLCSFLPDMSLGGSFITWSGPYTDNTLVGGFIGYEFASEKGPFIRASIGPYYGKRTIRTATHWSFGSNLAIGSRFADDYELFASFWHFSNGSDLNLGNLPNNGEEFLGVGVSVLFD